MIGFLDCLKREWEIAIKAMLSGRKMAFRWIAPLMSKIKAKHDQSSFEAHLQIAIVLIFLVNISAWRGFSHP